jgi:hypothetical protein
MKIYPGFILLIVLFLSVTSCQKEESCDTNATLNGECFNLAISQYIQPNVGQPRHSREVLSFIYQYPPAGPQERVRFNIYADDNPGNDYQEGEEVLFEIGVDYADENGSFTFNGNLSAGGIPAEYMLTITKLDRENNLISGDIEFSYSNDFGSDEFVSSFTNVEVEGDDF